MVANEEGSCRVDVMIFGTEWNVPLVSDSGAPPVEHFVNDVAGFDDPRVKVQAGVPRAGNGLVVAALLYQLQAEGAVEDGQVTDGGEG